MRNLFSTENNINLAQALSAKREEIFNAYSTKYDVKTHNPAYVVARGKCIEVLAEMLDTIANNIGKSKVSGCLFLDLGARPFNIQWGGGKGYFGKKIKKME